LRRQRPETADRVLRALVVLSQEGDELALTCLLVCLRPGACGLVGSLPATEREVVSELAVRALDYPIERRSGSVAAGLLGDVRCRLRRASMRVGREEPVAAIEVDRESSSRSAAAGKGGASPVELLVQVVADACSAGRITAAEAELILGWRVLDERPEVVARRYGTTRAAAKKRRQRAELRLVAA
jgi:hypothetical protein